MKTISLFILFFFSVLFFFSLLSILTFSSSELPPKADVAVVLGTKVINGLPSPNFQSRIDHAIFLYENGIVDHILFTGGVTSPNSVSESSSARTYAITHGVPAGKIFIEEKSLITQTNFLYATELLSAYSFKDYILVSDPHHLKRASLLGETVDFFSTVSSPAIEKNILEHTYFLLRESLLLSFFYLSTFLRLFF